MECHELEPSVNVCRRAELIVGVLGLQKGGRHPKAAPPRAVHSDLTDVLGDAVCMLKDCPMG